MREFITVDRVANKIRQLRETYSGSFLLVEGSSDKVFYERFVNKLACHLEITAGKPSSKQCAIEILEILEKSNFQGVLAIVDADFDRLENLPSKSPNLLLTDTHDLETMLINSPALEKVVAEFGSEEKISQLNQDIREVLLIIAISIGYLRYISQSDNLNLTFNGITFSKFIDEKNWQFNELKLIQEVKNKSQAFALKDEDIQQWLNSKKINNHDPWQVCCGHDLVEILSIGLRKAIGTNKAVDVEPNNLERSLRLAYEVVYFCKTQLYLEITLWEINNKPFKVLQNDG
ncbi:DUF4435 domain-containing protein [Dolichospermum sp. ST_con]|nr:DUF4435 domain-containing protein [Dolichospermum sp. ST_con]MDD1419756.1 DUF4435 domain-containing protein [Dolichospermum sp. ST_sed1]MDD1423637.1 DUF4435 domain-containing protein [Dolichospermum sp. ST_sed9]MDD1429577.1 DUF4435 domain-containing protein [Dolichospermum sp. ST_sed6]MDD1436583.1 DUF4435 domain-containing protein [Dolichospermum sp. ST_sed10]MDD1438853.1 DUF4435 domain-containing protein [Dolichospermum sp. ST_sed3]MDD1447747.1 DUF4435 domain-containing protein [Dolichosp